MTACHRWMLVVAFGVCGALTYLCAQGSALDPVEKLEAPWTSAPKGVGYVDMRLMWGNPAGKRTLIPVNPDRHTVRFTDESDRLWTAGYGLAGNVLRVAVGKDLGAPGLKPGRRYSLQLASAAVGPNLYGEITVPQIEPGQTVAVDVLFKPQSSSTQARSQDVIQGAFSSDVWKAKPARVLYAWGAAFSSDGLRDAAISPEGTFKLTDVPLGGDLMVGGGDGPCILMVANVQKRELKLPEDATLVPAPEKLVACTVSYRIGQTEGRVRGLIFLHESAPRLPFASYRCDALQGELPVRLMEGKYTVAAIQTTPGRKRASATTQAVSGVIETEPGIIRLGEIEIRKGVRAVAVGARAD